MSSSSPESLVNPNLYQVFFMSCPCGIPVSFARHSWVVVNNKGRLARWDVLIYENVWGKSWGHLHTNTERVFKSLGLFATGGTPFFKARMEGLVEGGEGSTAEKMVKFIESSPENYPHCNDYFITSPNSNSYVQWILDHFPEVKEKLPWNAFGKGYEFGV